jgi:ribose transport system substrate-binding protein
MATGIRTAQRGTALGLTGVLLFAGAISAQDAVDPAAALEELQTTVLSTGPGGLSPTAPSEVMLTDEEIAQVQEMGATAAIVMHYSGDDWSRAQIDGLTQTFDALGIEIVHNSDADFNEDAQVSNIETALVLEPDIMVSIPTNEVSTAAAYQEASDAGVNLVFMDNVPQGFVAGEDFVSVVSADNYGNGVASAHLMAQALGGEGEIGIIYHDSIFFVTRQRYDAFKKTIEENYPGITIAEEQGIPGPDFAGEAETAASAFLTRNPDLDGIWAVWDVPAEGVMSAARIAGRDDLVITTIDLGLNVALEIAKGGLVYGLGAQRPFDQGVNEATLAAYALLGKEAPAYVALNALPVTRDNVLEAWETVYHTPPPAELIAAAEG